MSNTNKVYGDAPGDQPVLTELPGKVDRLIALSLLDAPPDPMRHDMDDAAMQELMDSIREIGLLQNLCVVPVQNGERVQVQNPSQTALDKFEADGGRYQVRAGHRRLLACRGIHLMEVPCKVFCSLVVSNQSIMAIENTIREEPSDYDLAVMYADWLKEPGITENALRRRAGKTLDFIYARVEILSGWQEVAIALHERKIKFAVARVLNREEDEAYMRHFLNMAIDQGATSKLVSAWVSEHKAHKDMTPGAAPAPVAGISVVVPQMTKVECCICGDNQSYNLRTVYMCFEDVERLRQARESAEAAPPRKE